MWRVLDYDFVQRKNRIVFRKLSIVYKNLSRSNKFEKINVAPTRFFSAKIKKKELIPLEFARITHERKLLNRFYSLCPIT